MEVNRIESINKGTGWNADDEYKIRETKNEVTGAKKKKSKKYIFLKNVELKKEKETDNSHKPSTETGREQQIKTLNE